MNVTITTTGKTRKEIAEELKKAAALFEGVEVKKTAKPVDEDEDEDADSDGDDDSDSDADSESDEDDGDDDDDTKEASGPDVDDVRAALNKLMKKKNKKAAVLLLKKFKVTNVDDLDEKKYGAVIKAATVATKA